MWDKRHISLHSETLHTLWWPLLSVLVLPISTLWVLIQNPKLWPFFLARLKTRQPNTKQITKEAKRHFNQSGQGTPGSIHPLSLNQLKKHLNLQETDHFLDLGSGNGHCAMMISQLSQCQATGIEALPCLAHYAQTIAQHLRSKKLSFKCQRIEETTLQGYTHLFIAWTTWPESMIKTLESRLEKLPSTTVIITTSFPIRSDKIRLEQELTALFTWGIGTLYIHKLS